MIFETLNEPNYADTLAAISELRARIVRLIVEICRVKRRWAAGFKLGEN